MVMSSGAIGEPYRTLGMVIGFASATEGCGGGINGEQVYQTAMKRLQESATAMSANAVIFVSFQNRAASKQGCGGPSQVFEVFAWGTAVYVDPASYR